MGKSRFDSIRRRLPGVPRVSVPAPVDLLSRLGDTGIVVCLVVAPLLLGGRHGACRFVYALGAVAAFAGVAGSDAARKSRVAWPWFLSALFVVASLSTALQVAPLPGEWIATLRPMQSAVLPLWGAGETFGDWRTVSLTPGATLTGLGLLASHGLLFFAVYLRIRREEDVRLLLKLVALATVALACLGQLQHALGDSKLFGVYSDPYTDFSKTVQGSFTNRNHFAHLMALGFAPLLALTLRTGEQPGDRRLERHAWVSRFAVVAVLLVAVSGMASQSRGGVVSLVVATISAFAIRARAGGMGLRQIVLVATLCLLSLCALSFFDYDRVIGRLDDVVAADAEQVDAGRARRTIWEANAEAFWASPLTGFGVGSHREVHPLFLKKTFGGEFTHAESGYLQLASETGLLGVGVLLCFVGVVAGAVVRGVARDVDRSSNLTWAAIAPGLAVSLVHSCVDFVWYVPGLLGITLALAAAAVRFESFNRSGAVETLVRRKPSWAPYGMAVPAVASLVLLWGPARGAESWNDYLRCSIGLRGMTAQLAGAGREQADATLRQTIVYTTEQAARELENVVTADPLNARAHLRLAGRLIQLYELRLDRQDNPMPLDLLADAALRGGFATHEERLAWLERAIGEEAGTLHRACRHALAAVRLGPLQGQAYLHLARLSFLNPTAFDPAALVEQATLVRPKDGSVLFEAGRQHWVLGNTRRALELFRTSAAIPGGHVLRMVPLLAQPGSAEAFLADLRPGQEAIDLALQRYRALDSKPDLEVLSNHLVNAVRQAEAEGVEEVEALAGRWRQASETFRYLERFDDAVEAAQRAAELAPYDFKVRSELATALYRAERFAEADPHLRWCASRRPDMRHFMVWLREGAKRQTLVDRNRRARHRLDQELAAERAAVPRKLRGLAPAESVTASPISEGIRR